MKSKANNAALQSLMMLLMPSQVDGLKRKDKKKVEEDEGPLATQELVEEEPSNEPISKGPRSMSFTQISVATKKKPTISRKKKGRKR